MSRSNGIGIIVWIYLIMKGDVVRGQTAGPNAVAVVKGQAMLDCPVSLLVTSSWIHTTDGTNNPLLIAVGCNVNVSYSAYYRTEQPGGNICRLIIANVTMQQAGVYSCNDGSLTVYRSLVTVIDPHANVVVHNQSAEVVEGDELNISCSINYNGPAAPAPSLRLSPYWTTSPEQIYSSTTYHPSTNAVTLVATVTVQKPTVPIFQCNTVFSITGDTSGYNATAPADHFTVGNTPELDVQYNVSTPNITNAGVACGAVLTCNSSGNPPPNYKWFYWNKTVIDVISEGKILNLTEVNQTYICEAYNKIRNMTYTASTNYNVSQSYYSSHCYTDPNSPGKTDLITTIVLAAVLGGYGLCNIIATIVFLVYYNRKSTTVSDDKEKSTFRNKLKLNARFSWLQRMLPCMNESRGNAGCSILWVILFVLMSILAGIIVFPILVAMVNCSRKRKNETSDTGMRNYCVDQQHSKTAGTPSTAAHGDFEDPYDEINTIRHDRKHTLEEPTSAKNTKDAKKVFYTRVNPNLNTEEDIERYSVSMSS